MKWIIQQTTRDENGTAREVESEHAIENDAFTRLDKLKSEARAAGYTPTEETENSFVVVAEFHGFIRFSVQKDFMTTNQ